MRITPMQYEKATEGLKKLAKYQETVRHWEAAMKGYRPVEGQTLVEVQIREGGTRYVTENDTEATHTLLKKSG